MTSATRDAGVLSHFSHAQSYLHDRQRRFGWRDMVFFRAPVPQKPAGEWCFVDRSGDLVVGFRNTGVSGKFIEIDVSVGGALVCTATVPPGACVPPLLDKYPIPQISLRFHEVRIGCRYRDEGDGEPVDASDEVEIVFAVVDSESRRDMCTTPWVMGEGPKKIRVMSGMMSFDETSPSPPCNTPDMGDAVRTLRFSLPSDEIYARGLAGRALTLRSAVLDTYCRGSVNVVPDHFSPKWCDSCLSAMTQYLSENPGHKGLIDLEHVQLPGSVKGLEAWIGCGATVCPEVAFVRYEGQRTAPAHRDGSLAGGAVTVLVFLTESPDELTVFPRAIDDDVDDADASNSVECRKGTAVCFGVNTMHAGYLRPGASGERKAVLTFEVAF